LRIFHRAVLLYNRCGYELFWSTFHVIFIVWNLYHCIILFSCHEVNLLEHRSEGYKNTCFIRNIVFGWKHVNLISVVGWGFSIERFCYTTDVPFYFIFLLWLWFNYVQRFVFSHLQNLKELQRVFVIPYFLTNAFHC
jgi:hypothetical protein